MQAKARIRPRMSWQREVPRFGFAQRSVALLLMLSMASSCARNTGSRTRSVSTSNDTIRYRLLLRDNPVDPGEAFRCHGHCQTETSPKGYLECLMDCPGFDVTPNELITAIITDKGVARQPYVESLRRLAEEKSTSSGA